MSKPLAVQLYSARDQIAEDRDAVLRRLAGIGFGAVEPFQPLNDPAGFRKVADDLGLTVCAAHAADLVQGVEPAKVFDALGTLGTDQAIVPGGIPRAEFATADGVKRVADRLNGLAEQARARGISLGYHNHEHELEYLIDGRHALDVLADALAPEVFLEVDTYWAAVGGADVPALLRRHADRVRLLHVKDGPAVVGEHNVVVGSGSVPVPEYLAAAPDAWRVIEFDRCATDVLDALEASYRYVASLPR
ncbi:sugar phosphate isomerase/epimerase family protein [Phytoactinopolyspora halotolerans]|uniref:Sugar phosphate isomerase/epimerase n=1 Tax=Phytoactinopolyspora halotolerans TaxID=1981512 RepID=A0A6L9S6Y1_9ACTN|nr:sugar phosphate isomerase/epimerase [Phytoactinopolyspora halotolerans]NEE00733.1 sugar phosphate isomerase/epimerase [Phytoactinopolyspora halotolerans]